MDRLIHSTARRSTPSTIVGNSSAFLLHGYVGFIFGSVKANPWWSSVLISSVFLFSAIVSEILRDLIFGKLFISLTIVQILLGTIAPILLLAAARFSSVSDELKRLGYFIAAALVQVGIFGTRWNVVIGGQLFSKSLRGLTVYKIQLVGPEGLLTALALLLLPFLILYVLVKVLPPWEEARVGQPAA